MDLSPLSKIIPSWGAPTLEGFDTSQIQDGQRLKSSNRQFVQFYKKSFVEVYASEVKVNPKTGEERVVKTGTREVEREMVKIVTPGDKNEVDDFAQDYHKREHWNLYAAFRDGRTAPVGTSIDECSFIAPSIATELRYLNVHTLEQFADASDLLCDRIANGWDLREYARATVKANLDSKSSGQVNVLKSELVKSQEVIAAMQEQMESMQSQLLDMRGDPTATDKSKKKKVE